MVVLAALVDLGTLPALPKVRWRSWRSPSQLYAGEVTDPDFLSPAWVHRLNETFGQSPGSSTAALTVQYVVSRADGSEAAYAVTLAADRDHATDGMVADADVTFRMDEETAAAISGGQLSSEEAFIKGNLRIDGDPTALMEAFRQSENDRA